MKTIIARYVGLKPQETDCVAGTGLTWVGVGAEHPVSEQAAKVMRNHPDVWELLEPDEDDKPINSTPVGLADATVGTDATETTTHGSTAPALTTTDTVQLPDLTNRAALIEFGKAKGIEVHPNAKLETVIKRLTAAGALPQVSPTN